MTKYLLKRLLHGLLSVIAVVAIVMLLVYSLMDRDKIFKGDTDFSKKSGNIREVYKLEKWEAYGYLDYVNYSDYVSQIEDRDNLTADEKADAVKLGTTVDKDTELTKKYVKEFTEYYESLDYTIVRLDAKTKPVQSSQLYAYKDISVFTRLINYFAKMIVIDNIHYVERNITDADGNKVTVEKAKLEFKLFDPAYNTSESGYKLSVKQNNITNYIVIDNKNVSFTTDASKATLFTWSSDYSTFSILDDEELVAYGFAYEYGNIVFDKLSNHDAKNVYHFEVNKVFNTSIPEDFVESENIKLETYITHNVYMKIADSYSAFVELSNENKGYFKVENNKLVYTANAEDASGLGLEYIEGGENTRTKFSPCIIGTGTKHKYLLYFNNQFPYIHQNLITINLGKSYSVNRDIEITETLFDKQDPKIYSRLVYPTGKVEISPNDLHTAIYTYGSRTALATNTELYVDDYANVSTVKKNKSKTGFSFVIGVIAVIAAYLLGVPLGIIMARKKDGFLDKLGTVYIIFIIAVPSLAYILMFKAIGIKLFNLPTSIDVNNLKANMYILPIISLTLPSVASLMKWLRRYMIDQMNSDYVKFARSGGLSESEIFNKHILKNAIIPIAQGIPGSFIGAITGAIITERIYLVPGAGYCLTEAIGVFDNAVIVGLTMFYAFLSIISLIAGDILMSMIDPRISFTDKAR